MERSIAIVAPSSVPFQIGGAEKFWWGLHRGLSDWSDHFVELIKVPAPEKSFVELIESYKTFSRLDLSHFDMIISTKYPAWMVSHPNHTLYLQHTLRGLYDTYKFTGLPAHVTAYPRALNDLVQLLRKKKPDRDDLSIAFDLLSRALQAKTVPSSFFSCPGPLIREVIHFFDRVALAPEQIKNYFTISGNVCNREDYLPPEVKPIILPHPSDIKNYLCETGEYIFTASRLNGTKRVNLIIEAMNYVKVDVPLKIAGTGPDYEKLLALAESDNRIEFVGHVPDSDLPRYYAKSIFVPFVPYDEDYGLITIEAMSSAKPVVTTTDAGGVCGFVEDGITGFCVPPKPEDIGGAMEKLASDPLLAKEMGIAAKKKVAGINWKNIAFTLLINNYKTDGVCLNQRKNSCLVCSVYPPSRTGSGAQRRLYHLCKALSQAYRVIVITFPPHTQNETRMLHEDHYLEISLRWPEADSGDGLTMASGTVIKTGDSSIAKNPDLLQEFEKILENFGHDASFTLLAHPFFHKSIKRIVPALPIIYDAPNVEPDMLSSLCGNIDTHIMATERKCCNDACLVICRAREDMERLKDSYSLPETKLTIITNGCETGQISLRPTRERKCQRKRLPYPNARLALFLGSANMRNQEATRHIARLAGLLPDVEFLIAGPISEHPEVTAMKHPENVHLLGTLPEPVKNMLLESVDIGLNPVNSGFGTNQRLIEYMAAGLPTISTPLGVKGIDADITDLIQICELGRFPETIRKVLKKPQKNNSLQEKGRKVLSNYDWSLVMSPLCPVIRETLQTEEKQ